MKKTNILTSLAVITLSVILLGQPVFAEHGVKPVGSSPYTAIEEDIHTDENPVINEEIITKENVVMKEEIIIKENVLAEPQSTDGDCWWIFCWFEKMFQ
jgi:hypothetical protein